MAPNPCEEYYVKNNVRDNERVLLSKAWDSGITVPRIVSYHADSQVMTMGKIPRFNIADFYGENFEDMPAWIIDDIRGIVSKLRSINIEYPDITPYNFIEYNDQIWVIDFGDAYPTYREESPNDPFVDKFINGENSWNPRFK